ncbi:tripartite tricarboxylate transporter substrate binding protein [Streptomyces calidiresistens]|uniref:Tripartite tricarboxylate transporter substrate binding protein n=1 Tax=Streptomyces calidiresistens TaxID=1485586 RepID=A0A7W3XUJ5_9ACTN|nr:tripartite tricarboxylate transporter substrate binding protein [Streptomyces calidiresistens]MBB0227945.1 tripartite tricarboxylate transporter substrate binding protein [Streptomyces calidiresistens]
MTRRWPRGVCAAIACLLLVPGCATGSPPPEPLRLMVPTPAGGGYDFTARSTAVALRDSGLVEDVEVFHLTGAAGGVALTRLLHEGGNDRLLLQMGLGLVGSAQVSGGSGGSGAIADATPLARLIDEPEAVVVAGDSPHTSLSELLADWRRGTLAAGVGSHPGGPDHLALMLTAEAAGLEPVEVVHERYDGGGELLAAVLSHRVDFAMTGISEFRHAIAAGELRVLAVTGAEPVDGIDAPTLRQEGLDLEVVNWRGLLAPPGLEEGRREELIGLLERLRRTDQWQRTLRDNGWSDSYLPGEGFAAFLAEEERRVGEVLDGLGLGR